MRMVVFMEKKTKIIVIRKIFLIIWDADTIKTT